METAVIHFIVLGVVSRLTTGAGVLPDGPLNVAVGENVTFTPTLTPPGKPLLTVIWKFDNTFGNRIIMTFSGEPVFAPEYEGRVIFSPSTGSLELRNVALNDTGEYNVEIIRQGELAKDGVTTLRVYGRISGVSLTSTTNLPIEGKSVNLTCEAPGTVFNRRWKKDGSDLILADNMMLYDENRGLFIHPLQRTDSGTYSCNVSNPFSAEEATFTMDVNYGPDNVQITGPSEVHVGQAINLICSAESNPSANYTWMLNGTEIHNSAVFTKNTPEPSDSGEYTCEVTHKITGRTSSVVHVLSVTVFPVTTSGCSGGCIAGIVIACLLVFGAAGVGGYYVYKKKINKKQPPQSNKEENVYEEMSAVYENI